MKIVMVGAGYVGLVSGVCFSDFGHDVICVDKDPDKIMRLNRGEVPIFEPGLEVLMTKNIQAGRLSFTVDLSSAIDGADAVFISVGTPTRRGEGHADLDYVFAAVEEIALAARGYLVIVTKSTVPVGTNRRVWDRVANANPALEFDVASNPEFMREGAAIEDFMKPDRVVVGVQSDRAAGVMKNVYRPLYLRDFPFVTTDLESAEMIKYAANAFLATKVTFINEIAALCEKVGADVKEVARGMGMDNRIGNKFLHAGPGYGGSCFPKDTKALSRIGQENAVPMRITETVIAVNEQIKRRMIDWWGPVLHEYYAGTEGNGFCYVGSEDWLTHPGTVGRPLTGVLHIMDDEGNELPAGEAGTIFFSDGGEFEYHNDEEKTASSRNDKGWSTLGDVGKVDEEGFLYLTDRKAYMIITGGVNVYPQEAENVLTMHPDVFDVAVIGVPNDDFGEEVKAIVQPATMPANDEGLAALERTLIAY